MIDGLMVLGRVAAGLVWGPVAVWTAAAGAAFLVLRRKRGVHPLVRYRLGQALLFALPLAVLVGWLTPVGQGAAGERVPVLGPTPVPDAMVVPSRPGSAGGAMVAPAVDAALLFSGLAFAGALLLAAVHLLRIPMRLRDLEGIAASARPVADPESHDLLERLRRRMGVLRPVALLEGGEASVPMTFGWRRPVIVIPHGLAARSDDLRMTLVHELVHVARMDFAWAVAERVVGALFAVHPLVPVLTRDLERHREASCDLQVLATREARPAEYAGLLFTLGARVPAHVGPAAGLATPVSHLRERIETMKDFENRASSSRVRTGLAALTLLVATSLLGACFSFNDGVPEADDGSEAVVAEDRHRIDALPAGEELDRALARLDAQIAYLASEIDEIDAVYRAAEQAMVRGEAHELGRRLMTRAGLLQDMYEERVREYERLKLEQIGAAAAR